MTAATPTTRSSQTRDDPVRQLPTESMRWGSLLVVLAGTLMSVLDFFIINVAIPSVQRDLHASDTALQWVVAGFALAIASLVITGGRLGDLLGRRRAYGIGLAVFTLASAACGLAPTAEFLIAGRIVQGASAALMMPQVLVIIQATFAGAARARGFTAYGLTMGIAAAFGQLIGGLLIRADLAGLGWRACFLINVPIGVLALVLLRRHVPDAPRTGRSRVDLVGVALSSSALFAVVLPLVQGQSQGWPIWTWVSFAAAAVLAAEFAWHERSLVRRGRQSVALGGALLVVGHLVLLVMYDDVQSLWALSPALAVVGAGMGLVISPLATVVLERVSPAHAGAASGMLTTVMQVGGAIGVAIVGILFYGVPANTGPAAQISDGFGAALYFLVAVNAAVVVLVQLLPRDRTEVAV